MASMFNPHHEDGFYDNEDAYFAREEGMEALREHDAREADSDDDFGDEDPDFVHWRFLYGDGDSEGDGYEFHDPYEGCSDE
jgi:hypothetical protein